MFIVCLHRCFVFQMKWTHPAFGRASRARLKRASGPSLATSRAVQCERRATFEYEQRHGHDFRPPPTEDLPRMAMADRRRRPTSSLRDRATACNDRPQECHRYSRRACCSPAASVSLLRALQHHLSARGTGNEHSTGAVTLPKKDTIQACRPSVTSSHYFLEATNGQWGSF